MKVATLQFAPRLGDVDGNIKRANELLKDGKVVRGIGIGVGLDLLKPDVLILPELALTGKCYSVLPTDVTRRMSFGMFVLGGLFSAS